MKNVVRTSLTLPLSLLPIALVLAPAVAGAEVETLDFPEAAATFAADVNDFGQVVGTYYDTNGVSHGFLYEPWVLGPFTAIDYPDADWSEVTGVNQQGDIVGYYGYDTEDFFHGFLRTADGTFSTIDRRGRWNTMPQDINASGAIVGCVHNPGAMFGWVLQDRTFGSETVGEGWTGYAMYTDINDAGTLVGWYWRQNFITSFVSTGAGRKDFQYPDGGHTRAWGVNSTGDVVGWYGPAASSRGFLLSEGTFHPIHVSGATWTRALGINANGDIVGTYRDVDGIHGFLLPAE